LWIGLRHAREVKGMRISYRGIVLSAAFLLITMIALPAMAGAAPKSAAPNAIVITFKDGHQQTFSLSEISKVEFKNATATAAAKSQSPTAAPGVPLRRRFVGKWTLEPGAANMPFYVTLEEDGTAKKSIGEVHGTWIYVNGEAHIAWDDGWRDVIKKVGTKFEKWAYSPGASMQDPPANTGTARNSNPEPI
jgi:hypothetical protein